MAFPPKVLKSSSGLNGAGRQDGNGKISENLPKKQRNHQESQGAHCHQFAVSLASRWCPGGPCAIPMPGRTGRRNLRGEIRNFLPENVKLGGLYRAWISSSEPDRLQ
jgi:hypothetical protein